MSQVRICEERLVTAILDVIVKAMREAGFTPGKRTEEALYEALSHHLNLD